MRKDDHLIFESFAQQRLLSDEQAAKMIADKIRGTPYLNIHTIKQYVSKYLGMVGKAPKDVDYLAAHVHLILSQQGLAGENAEQPVDGVTHTKNALGRHIMHMANYGIPTREEFIKIRHELHRFTKQIEDRGTAATEEEKRKGRHMVAQIRAYRSSNADDPGSYADDPDGTATAAENEEGLSDQEYHKARKDAYEGAGEELGHGPIKVQLNKDTRLDCYKAGTVQEVRFAKGTIFNCDKNVGDYYDCETDEYGTVAVFHNDVTVIN